MVERHIEILKMGIQNQLLLSEFYKKIMEENKKYTVKVIGPILPNPFFDFKDFENERN
jgi:hypothetical protein